MTTWIGVDPGEKRIGMSRSDPLGLIAHPAAIVDSPKSLVETVQEWAEERDLAGLVVGLPLNMDGTIGPIARRSLVLVKELREALPYPVHLWDERLTSRQVGKTHGTDAVDDKAAAVILQSFLDAGCPNRPDPEEMGEV